MTEISPRMGWPYPSLDDDPWYDKFVDFVRSMDASAFAAREDRNLILSGGGTITWTGSALTWTAPFRILSPSTGLSTLLAAATVAVADGQVVRAEIVRNPGQNNTVSAEAAAQAGNTNNSLVLGARVGTTFYFRSGVVLGSGTTTTYDDAGGGVGVHASTHLPSGSDPLVTAAAGTISIGDVSGEGSAESFARSDHEHAFPAPGAPAAQVTGAGTTGVATTAARSDHVHPMAAQTPAAHAASHLPGGTDALTTAAAGTILVGDASAAGVAASLARSDHIHALPAPGAPAAQAIGAGTAGASSSVARADHVHPMVAQAPAAHESTHRQGGSDALKLDDLATPDDNTDLDASVLRHGLLQKLSGVSTDVLAGDGTWKANVPIGFAWVPDIQPSGTQHAKSDEFLGTAGSAWDAKWLEFDQNTELTATLDGNGFGLLALVDQGAGVNRTAGMYQTVPAVADYAFAAKMSGSQVGDTGGTLQWGIFLSQDLVGAPTTADWQVLRTTQGAANVIAGVSFTAYNVAATVLTTMGRTDRALYMRCRVTGTTTVHFDWCDDGVGWHEMRSFTIGFTPIHMGFFIRNSATGAVGYVRAHWFRVYEGVVAISDLIPGGQLAAVYT